MSHHEWNDNMGEDNVLRDPWARCILVQCVLSEHILVPSIFHNPEGIPVMFALNVLVGQCPSSDFCAHQFDILLHTCLFIHIRVFVCESACL